jgi:hypothetical protein
MAYIHYFNNRYPVDLSAIQWHKTRVTVTFRCKNQQVYTRTVPVSNLSFNRFDVQALVDELTSWGSLQEVCNTPHYRPTVIPSNAKYLVLANLYDREQEHRGDPRRAWRGSAYRGSVEQVPVHEFSPEYGGPVWYVP